MQTPLMAITPALTQLTVLPGKAAQPLHILYLLRRFLKLFSLLLGELQECLVKLNRLSDISPLFVEAEAGWSADSALAVED